ncbi:hypothetical protein LguiA_026790 [Lonicera macranthoides]
MVPDHALISNYLSIKVRGDALSVEDEVKEMESHDVYGGGIEPWDVFAMHAKYPDEPVYLFTTISPPSMETYSNDIGAWKAENNGTYFPVEDPHRGNQVVRYKRSFFYDSPTPRFNSNICYNEEDSNVVIGWQMTEYTSPHYPNEPSLEYVLCKIEKVRYRVVEHDWEGFGKIEFSDEEDWEEPDEMPTAAAAA